jgi:hypothetical protein
MRCDVTASSRHERLVLYDPAAIPPDTPLDADLEAQEPVPVAESALAGLAERGQALVLRIAHEDCEATLRVLVDETPEPYLRQRGRPVLDGATLHVPGGKLTADGVEFLCRLGEKRLHSEGQSVDAPAGSYEVQVLNLMPWKRRHRAAEIDKKSTKTGRLIARMVGAYTWLGVLLLPANILIAPVAVIVVWLTSGWPAALILAGAVLLVDILVLAGFWLLDIASRWIPALKRASDAEAAFDAENPDVVVCLRRLTGDSAPKVPAMATLNIG